MREYGDSWRRRAEPPSASQVSAQRSGADSTENISEKTMTQICPLTVDAQIDNC